MRQSNSIWATLSHYSKSQRIGIILLFGLIVLCQSFYVIHDFKSEELNTAEARKWLAHQSVVDSLKSQSYNVKPTIYPFNPNFITDFKGYKLGMSVAEIDRLLAYRKQNKFVNSAAEFQAVTKVSDSLLNAISPYFKFPDWVNNKKEYTTSIAKPTFNKPEKIVVVDINQATKADLMKVYGIGDKISDRILEYKNKLGAFVSMEQLDDVWGLSPEVIAKLNQNFEVKSTAGIQKININNASIKELSHFPFFKYALAKEIVVFRSMNGDIKTEDLSKIKGFPVDKIKIIALYLEF
ncbi:ComEA family DNA-binding protein [Flavobacterium cheonhonense]|jgi:DNA uptake protein ComE-like DNA-binding protein|uniref:ComEA family DNA-binding protein n=1 Tax=Flavobacterium cheonhonense TaxID=706185 RepID=UPI002D7881EC|nr:helix-hairpin-helix domain-containing protein [Flavobacterium cheonhonense]